MMVPGRLLLLAALPLAVSCQSGGSYLSKPAVPHPTITPRQAEKTLKGLQFPMTRAELAEHFPPVAVNEDPPLFSHWLSKEPGDYEYCRLGTDLYLQMRVRFKEMPHHRAYPTDDNPVRRGVRSEPHGIRRGNRTGSIAITPDTPGHSLVLKGRPNPRDVVLGVELIQMSKASGFEKDLLGTYQYYKETLRF